MKLIYHYPNAEHFERKIKSIKNLFLEDIIRKYLLEFDTELEEPLEKSFFSNYIVYKNGLREYSIKTPISKNDFLIIVRANKQSFYKYNYERMGTIINSLNCSNCDSVDIAYQDTSSIISNNINLCCGCLAKKIEELVFNNIGKKNITDMHVINLGLSGERDSTLSLYFLSKYRINNNLKFKIVCSYNKVGLGEYDSRRLESARHSFQKYCKDGDVFEVNDVEVNMLDELKSEQECVPISKYCNLCYRITAFRKKETFNNKHVMSASGGGTIEDQFMERIYNNRSNMQKYNVNYSFFEFANNKYKIQPLENLPEDVLSLYAAVRKINYEVANCPINERSAHYICRKNVLNPLKAVSNWLYLSHKEKLSTSNRFLFGTLDYSRNPEYPFKTKYINGDFIKVDNRELRTIIENADEPGNDLEVKLYNKEKNSYYDLINRRRKEWEIILNDKSLLQKSIFLKYYEYIIEQGLIICIDRENDFLKTIPVNELEMKIFSYVYEESGMSIYSLLSNFDAEEMEVIYGLEYLRATGALSFVEREIRESKLTKLDLLLIDEENCFSEQERKMIEKLYMGIKFIDVSKLYEIKRVKSTVVFVSKDIVKNLDHFNKVYEKILMDKIVIFVDINCTLSVFAGEKSVFEYWLKDKKILRGSFSGVIDEKLKMQSISILVDLTHIDQFRDNLKKDEGILYYFNYRRKEKLKQLVKSYE